MSNVNPQGKICSLYENVSITYIRQQTIKWNAVHYKSNQIKSILCFKAPTIMSTQNTIQQRKNKNKTWIRTIRRDTLLITRY